MEVKRAENIRKMRKRGNLNVSHDLWVTHELLWLPLLFTIGCPLVYTSMVALLRTSVASHADEKQQMTNQDMSI